MSLPLPAEPAPLAAAPISIRPLASCLADDWRALRADLLPQEDGADAGAALKRLVSQNGTDGAMIAYIGDRAVGFACYRITRGRDALDSAFEVTEWHLQPDAAGSGAGARLIAMLYMAAEAQGAPLLYWASAATRLRDAAGGAHPDRKAA